MTNIDFIITPATLFTLGVLGYYLYYKVKAMDSELHDIALREQEVDNAKLVYQLADKLQLVEGYYPNNLDSKILLFHKPNVILPFAAKDVQLRENTDIDGFTICEVHNEQGEIVAILAVSINVWTMHNQNNPARSYRIVDFIYPQLIMQQQDEESQDWQ